MPASKRDKEIARAMFDCKDDITAYVVSLGVSVENTTRSEIDAMCRGRPAAGGGAGGLQDEKRGRKAGWPARIAARIGRLAGRHRL